MSGYLQRLVARGVGSGARGVGRVGVSARSVPGILAAPVIAPGTAGLPAHATAAAARSALSGDAGLPGFSEPVSGGRSNLDAMTSASTSGDLLSVDPAAGLADSTSASGRSEARSRLADLRSPGEGSSITPASPPPGTRQPMAPAPVQQHSVSRAPATPPVSNGSAVSGSGRAAEVSPLDSGREPTSDPDLVVPASPSPVTVVPDALPTATIGTGSTPAAPSLSDRARGRLTADVGPRITELSPRSTPPVSNPPASSIRADAGAVPAAIHAQDPSEHGTVPTAGNATTVDTTGVAPASASVLAFPAGGGPPSRSGPSPLSAPSPLSVLSPRRALPAPARPSGVDRGNIGTSGQSRNGQPVIEVRIGSVELGFAPGPAPAPAPAPMTDLSAYAGRRGYLDYQA